ncbi:TonB-dependent receptor [Thermoflexibacter ruber]|uniref:TonB dependent receptor n=1 Tax=Thermoflexibacter ruber TaxID=1003 RepID=A0A1I2GZF8_9BACT|nr:hypothetical protein [Thermoflexibacter ruber]SFF23364.1 hypothetical protein SAMN04488541_102133 [Thermoflexibacter ruber]
MQFLLTLRSALSYLFVLWNACFWRCCCFLFILFFLLTASKSISAQSTLPPSIKDYWIDMNKWQKPIVPMSSIEPPPKRIENKYHFHLLKQAVPLQFNIRPMLISKLPQKKLYGNYIKAGMGNYFTSYAEAFFNNKRSEKYNYGIHVKHLAARTGKVDEQNSGNSQNELNFTYKYFIKKNVLSGSMDLQQNQVHFYGYKPFTTIIPPKDQILQRFHLLNAQVGYSNKPSMNKNSFELGIGYHYLADRYQAREQEVELQVQDYTTINPFQQLSFKTTTSISKRSDSEGHLNRRLAQMEVAYQLANDKIKLQFGGKVATHNDTLGRIPQWNIYPKLYFSWNTWKNKLNFYLGLEGGMQKRLLRKMIHENPFLAANVNLSHTNQLWESFAGIQTQLSSPLNWKAKASYGRYQNLHFFINDSHNPAKFLIQYETQTVPVFQVMNEIGLSFKKFRTSLKTEFFQYHLQTLAAAWHRPLLTNTLSFTYRYKDKLSIQSSLYHLSGITAFDINKSASIDFQDVIDLGVQIDYAFSTNWSIFFKGNNLLAQPYQRFLCYDVRTTELLGGVSFAF